MWKLGGMSNPVMHYEVAPGQLEISPKLSVRTFCPNALGNERTQTLDETFACLGVVFVSVLANVINVRRDTLRACFVHAGNDHLLGAQEPPPAIISMLDLNRCMVLSFFSENMFFSQCLHSDSHRSNRFSVA